MAYNLFDPTEDDDEDKLSAAMRERFLNATPAPTDINEIGQQFGGQRNYSVPDASLQPDMVGRFLSQRAPEADQAPPYPIPNRQDESHWSDYVVPALAMGADLLVGQRGPNGQRITGTQVGNIAGQAMQHRSQLQARGDEQFENDRKAYINQGENEARKQQLAQYGRSQDQRDAEIDLQRSHQQLMREKFMSGLDSPETKAAELAYKEAQTRLLGAQATQAAVGEDGLTAAQREAGKDRDEATKMRGQIASDNRDARKIQADAVAAQRGETARIRAENTLKSDKTTFLDKTEEERSQASALKGVEGVVGKYATNEDLPGSGKLDSNLPAWLMHPLDSDKRNDADTIKKLANQAAVYFRHEVTGASGTPREDAIHQAIKGLSGTEQEFRNALKFWHEDLQNKLKTRASVSPEAGRAALEEQGLGQWTYGNEPPPPPAAAASPGSVYQAGSGRRQAAGAAPMGGGVVNAPSPPMGQRFDGRPDTSGDLGDLQNQNLGVTGQPPMVPLLAPEAEDELKKRGIIFRGGM